MLKIGIVGLGAIGRGICHELSLDELHLLVVAVSSRNRRKAENFLKSLKRPPPWVLQSDLIGSSDLVVEASGGQEVPQLAENVFNAGKDLLIISVGALLQRLDLIERARLEGRKLYIPTGAIVGLDGVKSAMAGRVDRVIMTTRKPPRGLVGAPYLVDNGISVSELTEPKVVFEGNALEAARGFPENVNVCAGLSLAGVGPVKTQIRIVADPALVRNMHRFEVEGEAGRFEIQIENIPTENPKTGKLTAMSIVATLRGIVNPLSVGT